MRFDARFKNLPAPSSGELCDSGIASFGSDYCHSGGLDSIQDEFQKLRLGATVEEGSEQQIEHEEQIEEVQCKGDVEEDKVQLTADAFDQDQEGDT